MAENEKAACKEYNKLVRDNIPQIIRNSGKKFATETYCDAEFREALLTKLVEEAVEASNARSQEELVTELADLYEVIDAVILAYGLDKAQLLKVQTNRREERGGFNSQLKLLFTE